MIKNPIVCLGRKGILLCVIGMADRKCGKSTSKGEMCMLCFLKRNEAWYVYKKKNVRMVVFGLTYMTLVCE